MVRSRGSRAARCVVGLAVTVPALVACTSPIEWAGDAGASDGSTGTDGPAQMQTDARPPDAGYLPRRPHEGVGVTAGWALPDDDTVTVVSVDRFWMWNRTAHEASPADPGSGWITSGRLADEDAWLAAPTVGDSLPFTGVGLTAGWRNPVVPSASIAQRTVFWMYDYDAADAMPGNPAAGWVDQGILGDNSTWQAAPLVDGQRPYEGDGITAGWHVAGEDQVMFVSGDRFWLWDRSEHYASAEPESGWVNSGRLSEEALWQAAPTIDGLRPFEGEGVTAGWLDPGEDRNVFVSVNRLWKFDKSEHEADMDPASGWVQAVKLTEDAIWMSADPE